MALFEVEGTTLLDWSARVDASSANAAVAEAERRADEVARLPVSVEVNAQQHRVTRCEPSFRIEGTTLVSWTVRVEANGEAEAAASARRAAGGLGGLNPDLAVNDVRHRVSRCRGLQERPPGALAPLAAGEW